jgi:hypothetical protein
MSTAAGQREQTIGERIEERPSAKPGKLREVRRRDLGYRFAAGALTSIASGALTLACGPRVGGIMLAFPAILAASLTLIKEQEDGVQAREDARGATIGGAALALFAAVAALTIGHLSGVVSLLLATLSWFVGAFLGYRLAWFRRAE